MLRGAGDPGYALAAVMIAEGALALLLANWASRTRASGGGSRPAIDMWVVPSCARPMRADQGLGFALAKA